MLMEKQEDYLDAVEQKDKDDDEKHGDDSDEDGERYLE